MMARVQLGKANACRCFRLRNGFLKAQERSELPRLADSHEHVQLILNLASSWERRMADQLSLSRAISDGRLQEFIAQEEARGVGPVSKRKLNAAIKKLATTPLRSEERSKEGAVSPKD